MWTAADVCGVKHQIQPRSTCSMFVRPSNYRLHTVNTCFCFIMLALPTLSGASACLFCLLKIFTTPPFLTYFFLLCIHLFVLCLSSLFQPWLAEINFVLFFTGSYGFILALIWKQIQLWETEQFHRAKVSQSLALCHKIMSFRDAIVRGFRVLDRMFLILNCSCKTMALVNEK